MTTGPAPRGGPAGVPLHQPEQHLRAEGRCDGRGPVDGAEQGHAGTTWQGEWFRLGRERGNEGWGRWQPKLVGGQRVRLLRVAVSLAERNEAMKAKGREGGGVRGGEYLATGASRCCSPHRFNRVTIASFARGCVCSSRADETRFFVWNGLMEWSRGTVPWNGSGEIDARDCLRTRPRQILSIRGVSHGR